MKEAKVFVETRTASVAETAAVAREFAAQLRPGDVVALRGELGAGKTAFVQGVGRALGIERPMTSPTFVISVEYPTARFKFVHMDLYRLHGADDLEPLGWRENLESGAVICVEWPERAEEAIPPTAWNVTLRHGGDDPEAREIVITRKVED